MENNNGKIKSLEKAIDILDILCSAHSSLTLSELSKRSGYPKSTTHSLASTMRDRGLLTQLTDGSYSLGVKLFEYGSAVSRGFDISSVARPYLESLSSLTGANSVITLLDGESAVSLFYTVSTVGVQIVPEIGVRLPLHATSQGKLMLSFMSERRVRSVYKSRDMIQFTPHTVRDIDTLLANLEKIRKAGYSVEDGEYKVGLRSVSAPVFDATGELKYALTAIGLFRRISSDDFQTAIDSTVKQAELLSSALGYVR